MEERNDSGLTPEVAYVRCKDFLNRGISHNEASARKVKHYQIVGLVASLVIGIFSFALTQHIAGFFVPIVIINVSVLPLSIKVLNAMKTADGHMKSDLEKLKSGKIDPIEYYKEQKKYWDDRDPKRGDELFRALSSDTSTLTPAEKEMLSR